MRQPTPSPELLEHEARQLELNDAYAAAVMRACARAWKREREERNG